MAALPTDVTTMVQRPAAETGLRALALRRQRLAPGRASSAQYSRCKLDLASAERSSAIDQELCPAGQRGHYHHGIFLETKKPKHGGADVEDRDCHAGWCAPRCSINARSSPGP